MFTYEINKSESGKFYPTKNGKRFNGINYARRYDACGLVKQLVKNLGVEKLEAIFSK